jgi:predicted RNase H-like HicB family nuclease
MQLTVDGVVGSVYNHCSAISIASLHGLEKHSALVHKIALLAREFDLCAIREYRLSQLRPDGRHQFTDVVWMSGSDMIAAFEVDSSLRKKSFEKLSLLPAQHKFWVYYGNKDSNVLLTKYRTVEPIVVINLSRTIATSVLPDIETPLEVRQRIQQAIRLYWKTVPEKERLLPVIEKDLIGLVQQTLKDIEIEIPALGMSEPPVRGDSYLAKVRAQYPRAYDKWTEGEDALLVQKHSNGTSVHELSNLLHRQPSAIRSRLRKLGVV